MKRLLTAGCLGFLCGGLFYGTAQAQDILPAGKIDSVQHALKKTLDNEKSRLKNPLKGLKPPKGQGPGNLTDQGKQQLNVLLTEAKSPLTQLDPGIKLFEGDKPIAFNQLRAEVDYSYVQDSAGTGLGVFRGLQGMVGYRIEYGVSLASMPFNMSIRESNGINTMNYTPFNNFYKFNFDHEKYVSSLRSKVLEKVSPEAITNSALNRINGIRHTYEQQLKQEIEQIQQEYNKTYRSVISIPAGATNLSSTDMGALRTRLLSGEDLARYQQESARLQEMAKDKDPGALSKDSTYQHTMGAVRKYEAMEKIYSKITTWQRRFTDNPVVRELKSQSAFTPGGMKAYLSDPQNLGKVLDDQASLTALQKLFYNIKKLDIGQNAAQSGDLALKDVVNTGVNTEFQNKHTTVGVIYGKNNSVNNWQQAGLTSQVTSEYNNLTGFKIGTGSGSPIDQSISLNFFTFNNRINAPGYAGSGSSYLPVAPRRDGVISLHTGLQLGGEHSLTLDISKSFGSFRQNVTGDSAGTRHADGGSVFNNAGKANYAAVVSYAGELWGTALKLFVKKVGLGYNNPGNPLLRSGESQLGIGLARKFLQQRISVKYDGDYRRQVFDPGKNYVYSAFTNKIQTGYKFNRNDRVSFTYYRSDYRTEFYAQPATSGSNTRLQLDGAYRLILDGRKIMNNITISRQQTSLPMTTGGSYKNASLLLTNTASTVVGKDLLSLTVLANKSESDDYYFNTSLFSSEANYSYTLSGTIRMSSSLGYYANYGWNRQIGMRQQISATLNQRINLDIQAGYKKAIQITQPLLANQLFVMANVLYNIK